jgi:adenine-specific DNA-methyltransferase
VPAWLLDTDYNGLVFHGSQVFFPRTKAWENLKKRSRLRTTRAYGNTCQARSVPHLMRESIDEVAVKVIDDRGNELIVVKALAEAV